MVGHQVAGARRGPSLPILALAVGALVGIGLGTVAALTAPLAGAWAGLVVALYGMSGAAVAVGSVWLFDRDEPSEVRRTIGLGVAGLVAFSTCYVATAIAPRFFGPLVW